MLYGGGRQPVVPQPTHHIARVDHQGLWAEGQHLRLWAEGRHLHPGRPGDRRRVPDDNDQLHRHHVGTPQSVPHPRHPDVHQARRAGRQGACLRRLPRERRQHGRVLPHRPEYGFLRPREWTWMLLHPLFQTHGERQLAVRCSL